MQDNTITLAVDVANNGVPVNSVFTRHSEELNKSTYVEAGHTVAGRDIMQFYRTAPKPNGESRGHVKTAAKFTKDFDVANAAGDGNITLPSIVTLSFSVPVGLTPAQTLELRQRIVALADDDTIMADLIDIMEI